VTTLPTKDSLDRKSLDEREECDKTLVRRYDKIYVKNLDNDRKLKPIYTFME